MAYDFRQHGYTERNYISDPDEWSNLFHWKGRPTAGACISRPRRTKARRSCAGPRYLQAKLQAFLPTGKEFDIVSSNVYTVHQRVATQFRSGRAILAGDSAHVNSPIGAMGMNSGVHDAFNLADKLIGIFAAKPTTTCSTAMRQRRHVAIQHSQADTIRNKRVLAEKDPAVRKANHDQLRRTAEDPSLRARSCCAHR